MYAKSIDFGKKKNLFSWIQTRNLLNASWLLYPLSYMAVVFNGMLLKFFPLHRLQPTAQHNLATAQLAMTNLKEEDNEFMMLGS